MTLSPGTRLGAYEIVAPLGKGGMGEVWRARDVRLGREVAIKALPAAFARDPERLARFEREAQTLASLNHANIASIYGLEGSEGAPHLVLELVEGESLVEVVARGPLPPAEALRVGLQVAAAVAAAHERGVVHRDLKPGNVMLTPQGVVKVLDFGLAKSDAPAAPANLSDSPTMLPARAATMEGIVLGTAAYMSPEQARGKAVDRRSDVWSFGCLLFECFAGCPAFEGGTTSDLIAKILEREPEWARLPASTPPRAREILRRCLRKDADERPRDIRDVGLELADLVSGGAKGDAARERSVAVLPFDNLGAADDAYFADGMTDEILNALAHLEGLRVAARTSCFAFKGKREDLRTVGEKLDVATVLEGSVRRSGSRLRITVQLVNAADGYQLWSERYDREVTDVFEVQDEIAGAIAAKLKVSFHGEAEAPRARHGTASLEAYELFLKGRALQQQRRQLWQAIAYFEQAIALDPDYVEALAWQADSYRLLGTFGAASFGEVMPRARELAERALAIDPTQAEALTTLADVHAQYDRDFARAEPLFTRALEIDPRHSRARCERALWGHALGVIGGEDAVREIAKAVDEDPLNAWATTMLTMMLCSTARYDEAVAAAERAVAIDHDSFVAHFSLVEAYGAIGKLSRAVAVATPLLAVSGRHPWAVGLLGWVYARLGDSARARAMYDELEARSRSEFVGPFWIAIAASAAGLDAEAMHNLGRAVREREPLMVQARMLVFCDRLRANPRFDEVTRGVWQ